MPKPYSTDFQKTINAVSADEFPLVLIEISRDDLAQPIRIVNDRTDLTHQGNVYQAMGFRVTLPDEPESGMPTAAISIDNVGKELTTWIENCDWAQPTTCKMIQVLRSNPNVAEWTIVLSMSDVAMNSLEVTARLGFEDIFNAPGVNYRYTAATTPGLF